METRYYDICNLIYLNYSTVYNIIMLSVIYYILYDTNFKDTTNCISSNDCLVDCVKMKNILIGERKRKL